MKRRITSLVAILLVFTTFMACKKEDTDTQKFKMTGRWQVNKIEKTSNGGTVAETINSGDFMDFKSNTEDEVEVKLGNLNTTGNYVVLANNSFNLSLNGELIYCTTTVINDTSFQFTGKVDQSNPQITKTYYLSR